MNQNVKKYFFDETTQQPRWGMILVVAVIVVAVLMYVIKSAKSGYKPETTPNGGQTANNGTGPLSQPPTSKEVPPAPVNENLDNIAIQLQRVNDKTYWMACSGSSDKNERCDWYKTFLALSDASTKTVANIYQQKFSAKLYDSLPWACDCPNWKGSGSLVSEMKKKLENLGLK